MAPMRPRAPDRRLVQVGGVRSQITVRSGQTRSKGRQSGAFGVTTMGTLTSIGREDQSPRNLRLRRTRRMALSARAAWASVPRTRRMSRPNPHGSSATFSFAAGSSRPSDIPPTFGSTPFSRSRARALREVPQAGLWKMTSRSCPGLSEPRAITKRTGARPRARWSPTGRTAMTSAGRLGSGGGPAPALEDRGVVHRHLAGAARPDDQVQDA